MALYNETGSGGVAAGGESKLTPFIEVGSGGAVLAGSALITPYVESGDGGTGVGGSALLSLVSSFVGVSFDPVIQIDDVTFLLSWTSTATPPVTYRVYREGRLVNSIASSDGTASMEFVIPVGEYPYIEVLYKDCQQPQPAFPGRVHLNWRSVAGSIQYSVEENVGGVWTERQQVLDNGEGVFLFESRWLEDVATHQFRVTPIDAANNAGTPLPYSVEMVRHPDVPSVSYAYDSGTGTVTISAA